MDAVTDFTKDSKDVVLEIFEKLGGNSEYQSGVDNVKTQKNSEVEVMIIKF